MTPNELLGIPKREFHLTMKTKFLTQHHRRILQQLCPRGYGWTRDEIMFESQQERTAVIAAFARLRPGRAVIADHEPAQLSLKS